MSASQSKLRVELITQDTNLTFSTKVRLDGDEWDVTVGNKNIIAISHKEYEVPVLGSFSPDVDRKVEYTLNKIVGHLRNIFYFCFDISIQWGYIGGYGNTQLDNDDGFFPSIHNNGGSSSSIVFDADKIEEYRHMLDDIKNSRAKGLKTMLNYWRRAKELDDLGYDSEAFLNYFKVIECLAQLERNADKAAAIKNRFATQKTLQKKYRFRRVKQLSGDVAFISKVLATANLDLKIKRGLFEKMLEIMYIRHGWNIAHKLLRSNPYDTYDAMGQHSDEFGLVMVENSNIKTITQFLILNYLRPGKYPLGHIFVVK